ncbi:MAG: DNA-processing protein DprA [Halopseudomonas sp.]
MQPTHRYLQPEQCLWLQLSQIPGLGPVTLKQLWQAFGSAEAILDASRQQLLQQGLRRSLVDALSNPALPLPNRARIETVDSWLAELNHHLLTLDDPLYPQSLREIADPPPLLYLVGDAALLSLPQIALVGSRNATIQGLEDAQAYARYLSKQGLVPTSGLALGIDAAAHAGALDGMGLTVAVLGTGVDRIYPARHHGLAQQIVEQGGVLVSELPLGTPTRAQNFPKRNRIISGLSVGVLVVEAALKSGSLITARQASEQGREVFALPGSIHNPLSKGCHSLIRQGAILVDSAQQILQELAPQLPLIDSLGCVTDEPQAELSLAGLSALERQLLDVTGYEVTSLDRLVLRSGLPIEQVQAEMLSMELQGWVASVPGGYQRTRFDR